jgi:hypothetical protein
MSIGHADVVFVPRVARAWAIYQSLIPTEMESPFGSRKKKSFRGSGARLIAGSKNHFSGRPLFKALRSYGYQTTQIRATLIRFYMLTNMTLSAATPANRGHQLPAPKVLIYGSAIKASANSPGFINMQFSNRRQTGGLTPVPGISNRNSRFSEFWSSHCEHSSYQNSNRNRNTVFIAAYHSSLSLATPLDLGFSPRRMLLCLLQSNVPIIATKWPRAPK